MPIESPTNAENWSKASQAEREQVSTTPSRTIARKTRTKIYIILILIYLGESKAPLTGINVVVCKPRAIAWWTKNKVSLQDQLYKNSEFLFSLIAFNQPSICPHRMLDHLWKIGVHRNHIRPYHEQIVSTEQIKEQGLSYFYYYLPSIFIPRLLFPSLRTYIPSIWKE
jgi:hypothetical protein